MPQQGSEDLMGWLRTGFLSGECTSKLMVLPQAAEPSTSPRPGSSTRSFLLSLFHKGNPEMWPRLASFPRDRDREVLCGVADLGSSTSVH